MTGTFKVKDDIVILDKIVSLLLETDHLLSGKRQFIQIEIGMP
jgi:hypothetical protein